MVKEGQQCFNRFYFYKPDGSCDFYNKRHLFRMANEHQFFSSGTSQVVVEYKGEHLRSLPREIEKDQIGRLWMERSNGMCLFLKTYLSENGLDVRGQLDAFLHY